MWGRQVLPTALPAPLSATLSPALLVYLCVNVGLQGVLVLGLPVPFVPHSVNLGPTTATRVLSTPVPVSASPIGLDECLFFISLVWTSLPFDFLSVRVVRGGAVCLPTPPSWFSRDTQSFVCDTGVVPGDEIEGHGGPLKHVARYQGCL